MMASPEDKSKPKGFPTLTEWKEEMDQFRKEEGLRPLFPKGEGIALGEIILYGMHKGTWRIELAIIAGFEKGAEKFRNLRARVSGRPQRPQ